MSVAGAGISQDYGAASSQAAGAAALGGSAGVDFNPFVQTLSVTPMDLPALLSQTFGPRASNPTNLPIDRVEQMRDTLVGRDPYRETQNAGNPLGRVQGLFPGLGVDEHHAPDAAPFLGTESAVNRAAYLASLQPVRPEALPASGTFALMAVAESRPALKPTKYLATVSLAPIQYTPSSVMERTVTGHHALSQALHAGAHLEHFAPRPGESQRDYERRVDPMGTFSHSNPYDSPFVEEVARMAQHHNSESVKQRISVSEFARRSLFGHGQAHRERAFLQAVLNYTHQHPSHTLLSVNRNDDAFRGLVDRVRGSQAYPPSERVNGLLSGV